MDANPSNREIEVVVGPAPRSCTTWTVKRQNRWQGAHRPTHIQKNGLKATRIAHDTVWARRLLEARAESIQDPGQVRPNLILTSTAGGQEPRGSSARRSLEVACCSRPRQ
ncbi:hypothetical protein PanWU01x14_040210, partial [Parasponia andersonii]